MPITRNEELGVFPQQQHPNHFSSAVPIKKRKFPIIMSPSPSPVELLPASDDSKNREGFKSSVKGPSLDAAIDMGWSGKSDISKNSYLTANDKSDLSKNSVLVVKKEKDINLAQTNFDIYGSKPQETKCCDSLGSTGVVNKVNFLPNEKSSGSGVPEINMGTIALNVKKEIDSPKVEGDCKPILSTVSGNFELLLGPKEPLVPALEPQNSEMNHQKSDKLDSSLLNFSLYKNALVTCEISDDVLNNVSSHVCANNRSNWDLNTTTDAWEPSVNNNAFLQNKPEDSLCLSLGILERELNSSRDHSSLSAKVDSVRVGSNSNLQIVQLSKMNMNSATAVKLEPVDKNPKCDCTAGTSSTMELLKLSLMKREIIESCSPETVVPSASSSEKVVDTGPIKSEPFQECSKEICKHADSTVPQYVEMGMQHQERCASSSVLPMALTPQNSCPSLLPTFPGSTTSEDLSNQREHSFHTKNLHNRKDTPDEQIDGVVPKLVNQKGKEISLQCEKVENFITEDPETCKLNQVDEHPIKLCGNSEITASDEEKRNMPIDMLEADTFGSDGIHVFASQRGIGKRQRDEEDDYEDGEVREQLMHPTVEHPNVDRKKEENVKVVKYDTRNMESFVFTSNKNCNISDFDGEATVLDNHDETSSDQIKECVDTGFNEPEDEDGALQKSLPDKVTEVGRDKKCSNMTSPEKPLNLSGGEHVEEGDEKEMPGATNGSHGKEAALGEKTPDERTKEITLGKNDSTLPKAEASVDNKNYNNKKNAANSSNNASNKSRIINLPRTSIAASPCKTVSIRGKLSSQSGNERYSDLEGEIQLCGNRDESYTDGPKKFVKDRIQHQTLRNLRPSFIARRGRLSGRFDRLRNDWDSNHEFASESYIGKAEYQVSRHKHASSIADIELDYNGYGITPDNSALSGRRKKAMNDELPLLQHPSTIRIPPRGRGGPAMRGIPIHRTIPRNVSPSRCTDEDGSDMVGFWHNEKYIRELSDDDILDPGFTHPRTMYDKVDEQLVQGNRTFTTLQRKDYSQVRSKSPVRSRTRSPGPWSSPWRRSLDGHQQFPQHRSPTMYRMGRMRSPNRAVFPGEIVGRRHESPTFMVRPPNDIRDVDSGWERIRHRSDNSNRRTPPGQAFCRSTRRVNVFDSRERADGDDYMSGSVHSSRFHDVSGDERRKFGERQEMARSFRPGSKSNDNFCFHHLNDDPRPYRFHPDIDTDFIERSTIREREFDGRIKHQPLFVSGRMRNIEEQQDRNHRPGGQVWHDQGFNDVSRVKIRTV